MASLEGWKPFDSNTGFWLYYFKEKCEERLESSQMWSWGFITHIMWSWGFITQIWMIFIVFMNQTPSLDDLLKNLILVLLWFKLSSSSSMAQTVDSVSRGLEVLNFESNIVLAWLLINKNKKNDLNLHLNNLNMLTWIYWIFT